MNFSTRPITGIVRGTWRQSERLTRMIAGHGWSLIREPFAGSTPKHGMDDVTLTRKVETEIFRAADAPKGSVDVNVADGVVYLRGEVKRPEGIKELERLARTIPEVRGVENLLHLPKTPAPTRADTPRRAQRTGTAAKRAARERAAAARGTSARRRAAPAKAEPSPREAAARGEGRRPAPLGSTARYGDRG